MATYKHCWVVNFQVKGNQVNESHRIETDTRIDILTAIQQFQHWYAAHYTRVATIVAVIEVPAIKILDDQPTPGSDERMTA